MRYFVIRSLGKRPDAMAEPFLLTQRQPIYLPAPRVGLLTALMIFPRFRSLKGREIKGRQM